MVQMRVGGRWWDVGVVVAVGWVVRGRWLRFHGSVRLVVGAEVVVVSAGVVVGR